MEFSLLAHNLYHSYLYEVWGKGKEHKWWKKWSSVLLDIEFIKSKATQNTLIGII